MIENTREFTKRMTDELIGYIQGQARLISISDIEGLISELPDLRERFGKISLQAHPYLADQLEFLALVIKDSIAKPYGDPTSPAAGEAAFALLYFRRTTDLIPDFVPGMGLLDDAMIVSMVLRLNEESYRRSPHAFKMHWPVPTFNVDQLLSVISPLRLDSYYLANPTQAQVKPAGRARLHAA